MIKIVPLEGRSCPTPFCDVCEEPIDTASGGLYCWKPEERIVYFVHKGDCQARIEWAWGGEMNYSDMELRLLPVYLANNMAIPPDRLPEVVKEIREDWAL
ncbi:hypothetical protein ACFL3S_13735 [Gemmatimonadota bacterium]